MRLPPRLHLGALFFRQPLPPRRGGLVLPLSQFAHRRKGSIACPVNGHLITTTVVLFGCCPASVSPSTSQRSAACGWDISASCPFRRAASGAQFLDRTSRGKQATLRVPV